MARDSPDRPTARVDVPLAVQEKSPLLFQATGFGINPGSDLLSHTVTHAVPSAVEGLTSVFGMGTGVTPLLWPPETCCLGFLLRAFGASARQALSACPDVAREASEVGSSQTMAMWRRFPRRLHRCQRALRSFSYREKPPALSQLNILQTVVSSFHDDTYSFVCICRWILRSDRTKELWSSLTAD